MTILKDEEWKNVRAIVSTAFTSGKLKSVILIKINQINQY